MKITLAVVFLAGLTIYCKCTAVLSLPPSLIAHAASLEKRLKNQIPSSTITSDNDGGGGVVALVAEDLQRQNEKQDGNMVATDLYENFKNLWQKDLSLNLQKRERNVFDDQMALDAKQQHATDTIKNSNRIGLERIIPPQQSQEPQELQRDNEKITNNISKLPTGAAIIMNEDTNLNIAEQPQQQLFSTEYESNEWLEPSSDELTNDDFNDSPPFQSLFTTGPSTNLESLAVQTQIPNSNTAAADAAESVVWNKYIKPLKYWTRQCQAENGNKCPQEYYRDLIADRNNALLKQLQYKPNMQTSFNNNPLTDYSTYNPQDSNVQSPIVSPLNYNNNINNDDIVLLLTAEQNLIQFLNWALAELYPFGKFTNQSVDGADFYHPGMYLWKKLNLSGRLEPPLIVDEPRYVIARREYDQDDDDGSNKRGSLYGRDPFIPPRGRKHNLPDLDSLLQRYETFVPNRGRRDRIKDIFKYDDLFYPNRGKRQMSATSAMSPEAIAINDVLLDERNIDNDNNNDDENNDEQQFQRPLFAAANDEMSMEQQLKNLMEKMKRKLHQNQKKQQHYQQQNSFDEMSRNKPTRMSTTFQQQQQQQLPAATALLSKRFKSMFNILHKLQKQQNQQQNNHNNARRQWWKRYTAAGQQARATLPNNDRPASVRARSMAANRLQTLRSMSPLQQLTLQYQQQHHEPDYLTPPYSPLSLKANTKQQKQWRHYQQQQQQPFKSLAQQFDPLSWHKLQMLQQQQQQQYHLPLLTMRYPRLTALQHLPPIQQLRHLQLATPQETQLTYPTTTTDQIDNSITNDLDNFSATKDLD